MSERRWTTHEVRVFARNVITDGFCRWGTPRKYPGEDGIYAVIDRHIANNADIYPALTPHESEGK